MPELPEVETIKNELKREVLGRTFLDVWTDTPKIIKEDFNLFKKKIKNRKIIDFERYGKNLVIKLDKGYLLIHLKMTGHLLLGDYKKEENQYISTKEGPLQDKENQYLRVMFFLDHGMLALSDMRKFAKIEYWDSKPRIDIAPDTIDISFPDFKKNLKSGTIKKNLLDQTVSAGIGNIYADETMFLSGMRPDRLIKDMTDSELKLVYNNARSVLNRSIKLQGTSISDYRKTDGTKGTYGDVRLIYKRKKCPRCDRDIERIVVAGRGTYHCSYCQI